MVLTCLVSIWLSLNPSKSKCLIDLFFNFQDHNHPQIGWCQEQQFTCKAWNSSDRCRRWNVDNWSVDKRRRKGKFRRFDKGPTTVVTTYWRSGGCQGTDFRTSRWSSQFLERCWSWHHSPGENGNDLYCSILLRFVILLRVPLDDCNSFSCRFCECCIEAFKQSCPSQYFIWNIKYQKNINRSSKILEEKYMLPQQPWWCSLFAGVSLVFPETCSTECFWLRLTNQDDYVHFCPSISEAIDHFWGSWWQQPKLNRA